jgi:hypothetical protein
MLFYLTACFVSEHVAGAAAGCAGWPPPAPPPRGLQRGGDSRFCFCFFLFFCFPLLI